MARYRIGIDEVGRGPLAGPVTVCALALPTNLRLPADLPLRDSKQLTALQRAAWVRWLRDHRVPHATRSVRVVTIDRIGIARAANRAARNAFRALIAALPGAAVSVTLDGGLYVGSREEQPKRFRTEIGGDATYAEIALASIVAKVHRDRLMERLDATYPAYGLSRNKGYGTKEHQAALRKYGPSPIHRLSFLGFLQQP